MRLRGSSRPIRCGAGALVVLAAAALAAPRRASAGCSHDAVSGKAHASIVESLDRLQLPAAPARPAKPCDGLSCSGPPIAPMTSPVVPPPLAAEHWGCLTAAVAVDDPGGRPTTPPEAHARASRHGFRLDRPPRASALPHA